MVVESHIIGRFNLPSLILATPGCWAWLEMGALLAGVFCGVLNCDISYQ